MHEVAVFSDYICPFCFIGKQRIEQLAEEIALRPVWKPFEIHPEVPAEGIPIERFPAALIERLEGSVSALAGEVGIDFRMPRKLPNSRMALIGGEFAKGQGKFGEYHEAVFRAYFQSGRDIGDLDTLAAIAEEAGLDDGAFRNSIREKRFHDSLEIARSEAHALGLSAVPSFVFADSHIITGVQPYETMKAVAGRAMRAVSETGDDRSIEGMTA